MPEPSDGAGPAPSPEGTAAGTTERVRGFVARARRAPGALEEVAGEVAAAQSTLADVRATLARLEELAWAGRHDTRGGVTAVGDELHALDRRLDTIDDRLIALDAAVEAQAVALHRAVAAPARLAAAAALRASLGPPPALRAGLSVFTLCWNHGDLLAASVRSGLATLDGLPAEEQGEVLVLDDASTDRSAEVAASLAAADPRVRVIRAEVNLGLGLARSLLLHTADTTHAFQLDADNTALADGVLALYRTARATDAALTYGTVVQVGPDGRAVGPISNEPPSAALFRSNYIDTMAVTDVAAFRALGGWSVDPLLEHVDDWAAVHRVAEAGLLIAFVATLVGRYRVLETAFHLTVGDPRIGSRRVARVFDPTGRRQGPDPLAGIAAVALHPDTGPLWATPAAVALRPELSPRPPAPVVVAAPEARVLVVAPGGVSNLGDDAITVRGVERLHAALGPDVAVDLVTDGATPPPGGVPVRWLGPLVELLPGLVYDDLGRLDAELSAAAKAVRIGEGHRHALDPTTYDAAVILGGGSLSSHWSAGLIAPRAVLGAALRRAGVRYACSGQGIGPLDGPADGALVGGLLAGAVAVACRDEASADIARAIVGVGPATVVVTGDDALGLAPDPARPRGSGRNRPVLAVTVRRADYVGGDAEDPVRRWARAADDLAAGRGWDVVGLALNAQAPEPEIATLARIRATTPLRTRWHLVECGADPRRLAAEVAAADAVAAQSFHAALLAVDAGVPAVLAAATPYYRAKARGLAAAAGLPAALAVTDPAALGSSLDAVSAAIEDRAAPLAEASAAVDAWWAALPVRLGLPAAASATG